MCFDELWEEALERDCEEGAGTADPLKDGLDDLSDTQIDELWLEDAIGGFDETS